MRGMSAVPPDGGRFEVRRVGLGDAASILHDALAPLRAAPLRLLGLFLLLFIPSELLINVPTLGLILRGAAEAVAFTGLTVALDAAAHAVPPDFPHLGVVLRFSPGKLAMLILSGALPFIVGLATLGLGWGYDATGAFLASLLQENAHPSADMAAALRTAACLASLPFAFVQPVWGLYGWSGSRSMGANLLVCLVNWRWVLAMAVAQLAAGMGIEWIDQQGGGWVLLSILCDVAVSLLLLSWTLALARRSLPPAS
jgi:hypothetical protein